MHRLLIVIAADFVVAVPAGAQQFHRRATLVGGGGGDRSKCTIEVIVDGIAEVEIHGDERFLRNIEGRPAEAPYRNRAGGPAAWPLKHPHLTSGKLDH